jgi:hypothetical protein
MTVGRLREDLAEDELWWWMARSERVPMRDSHQMLMRSATASLMSPSLEKKKDRIAHFEQHVPESKK